MEIVTEDRGNEVVVLLRGDMEVRATPAVEAALSAALARNKTVIVDLSAVPFIDSSGLGALIGAFKRAQEAGKAVRLRKPTPMVSEILTITRMKRFFVIEE